MIASNQAGTEIQGSIQDPSPVRSLYILKNGLPVFTKDFVPVPSMEGESNQTLVSGFLTALTSFLHDMKDFGEMRSLITSSNYRFTFYQADSLLFVTCTDGRMDEVSVEKFLRNVSARFLQAYSKQIMHTNMINTRHYEGFDAIVQRELLAKEIRSSGGIAQGSNDSVPRLLVSSEEIRSAFTFSEEMHEKIMKYIDGKTSADEIAKLSGMEATRVNSFLRYMCKQGIISF
ncbi:MAG: winged helix-turn-helix domain-containing protein [Candidatus Lokiarchaeota archaeon]|nr:winged helix-turn-helix domain-containing protein [Candidatus Lokiarchaeota archaeon]